MKIKAPDRLKNEDEKIIDLLGGYWLIFDEKIAQGCDFDKAVDLTNREMLKAEDDHFSGQPSCQNRRTKQQ